MKEIKDADYIKELERLLIFMCECYIKAKEVTICRETEDKKADERFIDIYFSFPIVQSPAAEYVEKIATLRTPLGNKESNKYSMRDVFERMHQGRKTEREISEEIRKIITK